MDGQSLNLTQEVLAQIKNLLPEVFSEDKIDWQRLRTALGEDTFAHGEHYELSWAGKTEARKEIQKTTSATLIPQTYKVSENLIGLEGLTSGHIFIEGENLEVLRTLQKSYFGKVKMIYIDPPYNTGNDSFVYPDNFEERLTDYKERTGKTNTEGDLNSLGFWQTNRKENGQFHSVWLSMMYPRLYLSRNLLKEDGVIFISIDDNEASNLKLLCDEIFGEENFIGEWTWYKSATPPNLSKKIKKNVEYIFCYQKTKNTDKFKGIQKHSDSDDPITKPKNTIKVLTFEPNTLQIAIENGVINAGIYGTEKYPNELLDTLEVENGTNKNRVSFKNKFVWTQEKLNSEVQNGTKISLSKNLVISYKKASYDEEVPPNFIDISVGVETTENAGRYLRELFSGLEIFDYPKPVSLIKYLINFCCKENDIILDFFAGSGTTAQAVMELNEEDGGNRQFICVQMPEPTDEKSEAYKAGYQTIADITKARIEKVIQKIKTYKVSENLIGLACRYFVLAESNFKVWRSDIRGVENIVKQLEIHQQAEKPESTPEDMILELCLKNGLGLNVHYKKEDGFYKVGQKIWFCFEKYTDNHKQIILAEKPAKLLFLNSCFESDVDLSNFQLELRENGIKLGIV